MSERGRPVGVRTTEIAVGLRTHAEGQCAAADEVAVRDPALRPGPSVPLNALDVRPTRSISRRLDHKAAAAADRNLSAIE